jgi:hypothetical protein
MKIFATLIIRSASEWPAREENFSSTAHTLIRKELAVHDRLSGKGARADLFFCQGLEGLESNIYEVTG